MYLMAYLKKVRGGGEVKENRKKVKDRKRVKEVKGDEEGLPFTDTILWLCVLLKCKVPSSTTPSDSPKKGYR